MRFSGKVAGLAAAAAAVGLLTAGPASAEVVSVTVTPSTGLPASAGVTVELAGFAANGTVSVTQCGGDVSTGAILCRVTGSANVSLDGNGAGSTPLTVTSTFEGLDLATGEIKQIDCATVAGGCLVGAAQTDTVQFASAPISFG